jgi:hypothetical protein
MTLDKEPEFQDLLICESLITSEKQKSLHSMFFFFTFKKISLAGVRAETIVLVKDLVCLV